MKVSVVVPTYQTPEEGLERLVSALDAQSMSASEFEVIFVDDGSPDDTPARLHEIQRTRPNVQVIRIDNSGWPSRPRNIGTDHAQGEYVAYLDHDDVLYPDALKAAYAFAHEHGADVLNGKEAYTNAPHWALGTYQRDEPQSLGRRDHHPLLPMNPHKLYRRAFLIEHGIRFPEGRKVMWEDVFFNLQVARHAKVISTLSSVPYYHWVHTKGSGSTTFLKWSDDYWMWFRRVLDATMAELAGEEFDLQRRQLIKHQYVSRILGVFDGTFMKRPPKARRYLFDQCRSLQEDFDLTRFDAPLGSSRRVRAHLLQSGNLELMEQACIEDPPIDGWARAGSVEWVDGVLHVRAAVEWSNSDGRRFAIRREDGRIVKQLSPELTAALPPSTRDMTKELEGAAIDFSIRSRTSRIVWMTPSEREVNIEDDPDGAVRVSGIITATVDPDAAAFGHPLDSTSWDLFVRCRVGGMMTHSALRSDLPGSVSVRSGRLHLVFPNAGGGSTLLPDGQVEAVRRLVPVRASAAADGMVEVELAGRHDGAGSVQTSVGVADPRTRNADIVEVPATLAVADGAAVLRFVAPAPSARVRIGDRARSGAGWWQISGDADVGLKPAKPPQAPVRIRARRRASRLVRRARKRVGGILRRMGLR